jgi:Zn-dependent protease/predicted transcriptional regulator
MGDSISLGRIAGIRIGINWSVLLLSVLLVWTLATGVFPDALPDRSQVLYISLGLVAAVLFLLSILLHELGHAVQARRDGLEIDGITLWLLGGVARFKGGFPTAGAELRIALAGPAVSLFLGVVFVGAAFVPSLPAEADAVVAYIGYINVLLLVFNMLPALPLDGGRVLRAALWARSGDLSRATSISLVTGRVISFGLIGLGAAMLVFLGSFSGAWLAFIGWFLLTAAGAESRSTDARAALEGLAVHDVMVERPLTVRADATIARLMDGLVWTVRHSVYPVVDGGVPVGMVALAELEEVPHEDWPTTLVRERMAPLEEVPVVAPGDDLARAVDRMSVSGIGRALVIHEGFLVGMLSPGDVLRALELRRQAAAAAAERSSQPSSR